MRLDGRGVLALIVTAGILGLGAPELGTEWQFFVPGNLSAPAHVAPVLQSDPIDPIVDSAFIQAARALPRRAVCVIALDAWHRDYFRASYLLMPRQVWPYQQQLTGLPASPAALRRAMLRRHATCLLVGADVRAPSDLSQRTDGVYRLYLLRRWSAAS